MAESAFRARWKSHLELGQNVVSLEDSCLEAVAIVARALRAGRKMLFCGNGGSAADALHAATELIVKLERERRPLPAIVLGGQVPMLTACANDYTFDTIFERDVRALGTAGDVLVAISTSGRSENVRRALATAVDSDLRTIALLGRDGGFTKGIADVELIVPGHSTPRIQEWHTFILHTMIELVEEELQLFG
jgi:D-sedoheptulose 7-phosphate isomerase